MQMKGWIINCEFCERLCTRSGCNQCEEGRLKTKKQKEDLMFSKEERAVFDSLMDPYSHFLIEKRKIEKRKEKEQKELDEKYKKIIDEGPGKDLDEKWDKVINEGPVKE